MVKPAPAVKCEGKSEAEKRPSPPLSRVLRARRGSCMSSASACGRSGRPRGRGASWRSGYAEDCKSLYGGSIPSEASRKSKSYKCSAISKKLPSANRQGFVPRHLSRPQSPISNPKASPARGWRAAIRVICFNVSAASSPARASSIGESLQPLLTFLLLSRPRPHPECKTDGRAQRPAPLGDDTERDDRSGKYRRGQALRLPA